MPHRRQPLPPALARRPFSVADARAAGLTGKRLRSTDLDAPFRGVRAPTGTMRTLTDRCRAAMVWMRGHQFFSHATALELYGLPVPMRLRTGDLHIASSRPGRAPRGAGVIGHCIDRSSVTVGRLDGLPVLDPVHAWCLVAPHLTVRELVVVGDALVGREQPWTTPAGLALAVTSRQGRRGSRHLAEALPLVRPGSASPRESELRLDLIDIGLPEPALNADITDETGEVVAVGDLLFVEYRVLVEYDGEQHRTSDHQYARDVERLDELARLGYRVIRVNKSHWGARRRSVLTRVRTALVERGWRPDL